MMKKSQILEALRTAKHMSKVEFAARLGIKAQSLNGWLKRDTYKLDLLTKAFPDVELQWLTTGEGNMLKSTKALQQKPSIKPTEMLQHVCNAELALQTTDRKPVIPLNLYSENSVNVADYIERNSDKLSFSPTVHNIASYDCVYSVITDALAPNVKPGDRLALKRMRKTATIINGMSYILDTVDNGLVLRYVYDEPTEPDVYVCKAFNPHYTDIRIPKEDVYDVYKVIGLLRASIL